jgi:hypothetical protein
MLDRRLYLVAALALYGCVLLPGQEPIDYGIIVENRASQAVTFHAVIDGASVPSASGTVAAGETAPIFYRLSLPRADDPVFAGGTCTVVELIAEGTDGRELGRKPPGLCFSDIWIIEHSQATPS